MSKRTFIILGLTVNLLICITISVMHFTNQENGQAETTTMNQLKEESLSTAAPTESVTEITMMQSQTEPSTEVQPTQSQTESPTEVSETQGQTEPSTEVQPTQSQTESSTGLQPTQPQTERPHENMTTQSSTVPSYVQGYTKVQIQSSCNIRTAPDVNATMLGTARVGQQYALITTKCDDYWLAISYNGVTGYISNDFAQLLP